MSAGWWYPKPAGDPAEDRQAISIQSGSIVLLIAFAIVIVRGIWTNGGLVVPEVLGELTVILTLVLNYVGRRRWASMLGTYGLLLAAALMMAGARDGFRSIIMLVFPGVLLIAVMLLTARDDLVLAFSTVVTVTVLGVAEVHGVLPTVPILRTTTDYPTVFFVDLILAVVVVFGGLLARDVRSNLLELRDSKERYRMLAHAVQSSGLAMVHGIVQQNGGWIEVQSKLGQGTTFRIYSPQTEVELTNGAKPATPDSLRGEGTVLIVEDQHAVRRLTRKMLQARGYIILEAANGEKAHAVAKQHAGPIDLLLTDVVMPGTDGLTLSGQLQRLRPNLRVILMSGYSAG